MSYAMLSSFGGWHLFGAPLDDGSIIWKGFPSHSCSWLGLPMVIIQSATWSKQKKWSPPVPACISKHWWPRAGDDASSGFSQNSVWSRKEITKKY